MGANSSARAGGEADASAGRGAVGLVRVDLDDARWASHASWLGEEERSAAERRLDPRARARACVSRISLRAVLGRSLGRPPAELRFVADDDGRPRVVGAPPGFDFNLTHSGSLALVAWTASGRVGVDVECHKSDRPFERLLARVLPQSASDAWRARPEPERAAAFYALWTAHEAVVKASGFGIARAGRRFGEGLERILESPCVEKGEWSEALAASHPGVEPWALISLDVGGAFSGALCVGGAGSAAPRSLAPDRLDPVEAGELR